MTLATTPQWQQTVAKKRGQRDHAIQRYLDAQDVRSAVGLLSGLCGTALTVPESSGLAYRYK
ncbi:hypothetical protein BU23DRAFT_557292 [Bimuria novae-zelandiae CBS 107.79]|uniref:Uncharacterized protein n=1 Tax=Bimuria novae-zelandiae CBS 107.79 TaxID=1447943 RepID=A0A6A5UZ17_9PLEO|nr:hypothetical protein BU23DRAFT_557292 [Bimuria novae-zelandiae CBS 107.79]